MKLFMTERPLAMTAACFPVPARQSAHAYAVGRPSVSGTASVRLLPGQECVTRQESAIGAAQRIRIHGRVLTDVKGINGSYGKPGMAKGNGTLPGADQVGGVPPRGRQV